MNATAQHAKMDYKLYGGPTYNMLTNTKDASLANGRLGATGGFEAMYNVNSLIYLIAGANFSVYNLYYSIDSIAPEIKERSNNMRAYSLEAPLGVGFNIARKVEEGFFVNLAMIHNYTFSSSSDMLLSDLNVYHLRRVNNSPISVYNIGGKAELGYKGKWFDNKICVVTAGVRQMFWNMSGGTPYTSVGGHLTLGLML
jgi:hypothetical protein